MLENAGPIDMRIKVVRLATRSSPLALVQSHSVGKRLVESGLVSSYELVYVATEGDIRLDVAIAEIARRGVFTAEVEIAVLDGRADVAVHSAKDLPSSNISTELVLASVPMRADARDALVGAKLSELTHGATIATGSARRRVQLAALVPGVRFVELRGNIATRLTKVPPFGAAVFAYAALERLSLVDHASEVLGVESILPQVGQGAIALRCRATDVQLQRVLAGIDDPIAHRALLAERAYLARLGGSCDAPVGAYATIDPETSEISLEALLASDDGSRIFRRSARGDDPVQLGCSLAEELLAIYSAGTA